MKKNVTLPTIFLLSITKIVCTILIFFTNGTTMYFSIYSLLILVLLPFNGFFLVIRIIGVFIVVLIWLTIPILCVLGLKKHKLRIFASLFFIFACAIDFVMTVIFSVIQAKIFLGIICAVLVGIGVKCLYDCKKTVDCPSCSPN